MTRSCSRTMQRILRTKLGIHARFAPPTSFVLPVHHLLTRGGVSVTAVSGHMDRILTIGFHLKLFSTPCQSGPGRTSRITNTSGRSRFMGRVRHRSLILLGGSKRLLPLGGGRVGGMLIAKPLTSRSGFVVDHCNPGNLPAVAMLRNVGSCLGKSIRIICSGKYGVVSGR